MILNATGAIYYFYVMLFAAAFFALFYGIAVLYKAVHHKAVIAMVCITVVSFFTTGNIPVN
ncbi:MULTISPECIES: hypothetical protein [unclassified Hydrotalea]|uniref:hypothetical protein n=1 Tax=unclassified Hydrotalea TaxID=2643788 RepID=UPI001028366D|nr:MULTISPECIES: hypothetical protein [unclassified Hydrotalea]RWZ89197.1 MAG: hypothetical protein EO766_06230 [Hydrotalea sp. AMD]